MELDIKIGNEVKKITINNPKGKHQRQYINKVSSIGSQENPNAESMKDFLDWRDKLILDLCPDLKIEDIDELDMSDLGKIMTYIVSKFKLLGDVEKN